MNDPRTLRRLGIVAVVFAICWVGAIQSRAARQQAQPTDKSKTTSTAGTEKGNYVGSETCKGCHEAQFNQIEGTQHFKMLTEGGPRGNWHGCESCHGPGSAHVEGGGDKSRIITFQDMSPDEISKQCMQCHETNLQRANFQRSIHSRAGVSCTSCHDLHRPQQAEFLLKQSAPNLCFTCHGEVKADFMKPFRHRVLEGLVSCSDCHNVHGTTAEKMVRHSSTQDQVCFTCHADKKGPFVFEHEPVKSEGCAICHSPHGSSNPRLLNTPQMNALCLQCHAFSGELAGATGPHPQNTKSQACTICHPQIHGSNTHEFFFK